MYTKYVSNLIQSIQWLGGIQSIQWIGGSDKRSLWGIRIFRRNIPQWGAVLSYLKFPNHLIVLQTPG